MLPVDPTMQQAFAENAWLHFFQMGHTASTSARPTTILVRGEGSRVWDQNGNAYIDALSGLFCVNAGYGRREIVDALAAQLMDIAFVSPFSFPSLPQIQLAAELARISPIGPKTRSFFVTGGSEAVETALKLAKAYQRKRGFHDRFKTISRRVAYHGTTMGALSVNGLSGIRNGFGPLVPGARHVPLPHRYRCDYCALHSQCAGTCADEVERLVEFEGPETIAAIIMEPVQNSGGAIVPPPEYMRRIRQICDRHGILMIADEVICGFGRVGHWFGVNAFDVVPDIITCAKGITSGYAPLGAVLVRPEVADEFLGGEADKFMHGITFGGHPASCAAALANLAILEREQLPARAATMGDYLMRELRAAVGEHPNVGDIRGMGLFIALELVRDRAGHQPLDEPNLMAWLSDQFKRRGLICRADDRLDPVIQLAPPLNIPHEDADKLVAIVADVIHALGRKLGTQPTMAAVKLAQAVGAG
ncbi:MAG TPA: aminotransferase class III-fold pyridoxal phosphate-dependent enzyme [Kouleothrix sp.]|uniref:aminotransferase family protein n=1 Tax=Kouleothrix sp. TaxID=2779161 RepID=UPI002D13DE95|nr:aminotransferase class III-fold pyridoxal phosphate-dependent enzyme [Kouleothrix sp.]HRC75816.1 aminotransferase class III-fold pyridoxal phosphate-dependent enzyme [Kouleothrix sp.]